MDNLEINFVSNRFSRLAKIFAILSAYSTMFAFDRIIYPFYLVSAFFVNVFIFPSILSFNKLIILTFGESASSFCNCVISFVNVFFFPIYLLLICYHVAAFVIRKLIINMSLF